LSDETQHPDDANDSEQDEYQSKDSAWEPRLKQSVRLLETIFSNPDAGTPYDDRYFTQLNQGTFMDLPVGTQQKVQRLALLSYRKNAMAFSATEVKNDFCVGTGVRVVAADEKLQEMLDEFWQHNEWDDKMSERTRALSLFGEQLLPAIIRPEDGMVTITSISPLKIAQVIRSDDDAEELVAVDVFKGSVASGSPFSVGLVQDAEKVRWEIVRRLPHGDLGPYEEGRDGKQAFFFTINRVAGATRGTPDLCSSMDWLEGIDGMIFALMERAEMTQDVVFDLQYDGANAEELRRYAKNFASALRSGGIFAHNEKTNLAIQTPNLVASDASSMIDILKQQVYAGTRLAGLYLGSGADLTRSSAAELSIPVAKHFETRQAVIQRMLRKIIDFQLQEWRRRGRLDDIEDQRYQVVLPRIFLKDLSTISSALQLTSIALQLAVQNDWVTNDEASNAFRKILEALGTDVSDPILVEDRPEEDESELAGLFGPSPGTPEPPAEDGEEGGGSVLPFPPGAASGEG
jgi:hypothetical protein